MKMKLMKLMTVTALATAAVFGSFVESAEAFFTQTGNKAEGSLFQSLEVDYSFTLVPTVEDGNTDPISGFFRNAVTDFTGGFDDFDNGFKWDLIEIVESSGAVRPNEIGEIDRDGLPKTYEFVDTPLTLNLKTRLRESPDRDMAGIDYILQGEELSRLGITELILQIFGSSYVALSPTTLEPLEPFSDLPSLDTLDERKQAVNSLEYIIENELLGFANNIAVIVPESHPTNGLLALGVLGIGLGLKRRFQSK